MKLSWTNLKISIAGAKLSHLVQKDRIWDHGSMAEQARIIFYLAHKAKANENFESLRKQCTISCFEKIKNNSDGLGEQVVNPIVKEIAIIDVLQGKNNKADTFSALIKGVSRQDESDQFKTEWTFIRQGDWWLLDEIKNFKKAN